MRTFIETNKRAEKLKTLQAELGLAKAQQDKRNIEDLLKVGRSVAAPSRRELDFSTAVKSAIRPKIIFKRFIVRTSQVTRWILTRTSSRYRRCF